MKEHSSKSPDELKISFSKAEPSVSLVCFPPKLKAHSDVLTHGAGRGECWGDFHFSLMAEFICFPLISSKVPLSKQFITKGHYTGISFHFPQ